MAVVFVDELFALNDIADVGLKKISCSFQLCWKGSQNGDTGTGYLKLRTARRSTKQFKNSLFELKSSLSKVLLCPTAAAVSSAPAFSNSPCPKFNECESIIPGNGNIMNLLSRVRNYRRRADARGLLLEGRQQKKQPTRRQQFAWIFFFPPISAVQKVEDTLLFFLNQSNPQTYLKSCPTGAYFWN